MNPSELLIILNACYPMQIEQVYLHREMIGRVYVASGASGRYILKVYRSFHTANALSAIGIILYLHPKQYPVAAIVPTRSNESHVTLRTSREPEMAVLFDYIHGQEPDIEGEIEGIGRQVGCLHRIMRDYSGDLIRRGKEFYIDRFISMLRALSYNPVRIDELEAYGDELWSRMKRLPAGFCHGDLHTGNMLQSEPGKYTLFDFDAAARSFAVIDVTTLCDASNFNHFDESAYERTLRRFERFYASYNLECTLNDSEIDAIFDFIPIRHYELIATITECQSLTSLSSAFLDEQYDWLLRWRELCERKRSTGVPHLL
jgi:Ser/Thr protein kinase RdoA (MazF antagonist)